MSVFMLNPADSPDIDFPRAKVPFSSHMRVAAAIHEGKSMIHKFQVGQSVALIPRSIRQAAPGTYEITRLMPDNAAEPHYRIKSDAERHERVVPESELETSQSQA
ncbi:MAG TPA: hypothetical protein VG291_17905 [Xanthobacteraceae bacterium]|nr:hypothetical protein [Xanthobacteraceae bacterium]